MKRDVNIELAGVEAHLLGERALYLPHERALLLADAHWGKTAAFRAAGVPLPAGVTASDLERLSAALARTGAERLIVLGDLIHGRGSYDAPTLDAVQAWRAEHPALSVTLVRGNHDRRAGDPPLTWGFEVVPGPLALPPFVLRHEPQADAGGYVLAGHLHPAVRLGRRRSEQMVVPCFWFGARVGVLPAFGGFTGVSRVRPRPGDRVFVCAEGAVLDVQGAW